MRIYPTNRFVRGTYKRECQRCGFDFLRFELRKEWTGLIVCPDDWQEEPERNKRRTPKNIKPFKRD